MSTRNTVSELGCRMKLLSANQIHQRMSCNRSAEEPLIVALSILIVAPYLAANADLTAAFGAGNLQAGMAHYVQFGIREGRPTAPAATTVARAAAAPIEFLGDLQGADVETPSAFSAPVVQEALGTVGGGDTALIWSTWSNDASEAVAGTSTSLFGGGPVSRDFAALAIGGALVG